MQAIHPFRNTGWSHYDKMSAILPTTVVKGMHVYRPTAAVDSTNPGGCMPSTAPSTSAGSRIVAGDTAEEDGDCGDTMVGEMMTDAGAIGSSTLAGNTNMDVDKNNPFLPLLSIKRTHSIMSLESSNVGGSLPSDSGSTPATSFTRVKKKQMSAGCSDVGGSDAGGSNTRRSDARGLGKLKAEKVSQAAAVMGMQGSINRLTDAFEKSLSRADDPVAERQGQAIDLVQEREDELSIGNIVRMVSLFTDRPETATTYLKLSSLPVRAEWLRQTLEKLDPL
jgi:hypothetical protein